MKIAVWHNLPSGGAKRALHNQVKGLLARGHTITCWTLDNSDRTYLPLSELTTEHVVNYSNSKRSTKPWTLSYNEAINHMRAFDDACKQCATEIDAGDFDLLLANSAIDYAVPFVLRHSKLKKVLYLQEPCRYFYEARPILPWLEGTPDTLDASLFEPQRLIANYSNLETLRARAKQEWLNAHACDSLLVNSYFSRESILRSYAVEAKVCYLGVDTKLFRDLRLEREGFLVGVGAFEPTKGIELAVRAVSMLDEPRPTLVWIANARNESYESRTREVARSLGVELQVRFRLSDDELVETLNKASLMLYTSRLEPFGLAPLEANGCGLPVVGVAEGGIRETVKDGINGLLVEPDASSVAGGIAKLMSDHSTRIRLGEQAVKYVCEQWNLEQSVDRLEKLLIEAVS